MTKPTQIKAGRVTKDSGGYIKTLRAATSEKLDPNHPRHHNITMQVHHLISAEGVRMSGLGGDLVKFQYNINQKYNLIHLPYTLQGACHLGIQPHRGNHTARVGGDTEKDVDGDHRGDYHDIVAERIERVKPYMKDHCPKKHPENIKKIADMMNDVSRRLAKMIQHAPTKVPLTNYAEFYEPDNPIGCGGLTGIIKGKNPKNDCPVHRDHQGEADNPKKPNTKITYDRTIQYELQAGR